MTPPKYEYPDNPADWTDADDRHLIIPIARRYATNHLTKDDLFQEGALGLFRAKQTYSPTAEKNAKFVTYATRVVINRIIDALRKNPGTDESYEEGAGLGAADGGLDREMKLLEIKRILWEHATEIERRVFEYITNGSTYKQAAEKFNIPVKKVDNIVQKVLRMVRSNLG